MKVGLLEAAVFTAASVATASELAYSPPYYPSPWMDGQGDWAEAYRRAVEFVSGLTLDEKVNLTTGTGWEQGHCVGESGSIPRLGMWGLCMQDSPLGIRDSDYNSGFSAGVNVAATWDKRLAYARGMAMGEEHRDKGVDVQLGPVAGPLGLNPDGGRVWEGFAPDPVLSGVMMAETIKGMQDAGIVACAKHFIGYEQEHYRLVYEAQDHGYNITESLSANIDDKTIHELYLWPFADAVRAGVGSVMCSYNQINNSYACSNSYTMNKLLKAELGFQGFVMSDWGAHHGGVNTVHAGLDMSMPGDATGLGSPYTFWGSNLTIAVLNGTVPEWRIDDMATRIMAAYYKVGRDKYRTPPNFSSWTRDEYGYVNYIVNETYAKINERVNVQRDHADVIRKIGADSTVLLKNKNNALPLTHKERLVAIIGEDAGSNPYGPNGCSDRGCDNGTLAMGWGSGSANFPYLITPESAIQNEILNYNSQSNVFSATDNWAIDEIEALSATASVALVFVNADSGEGYIEVDGNYGDRNNMTLWKNGEAIIQAAAANCNNTIVIMHTPAAVFIQDWYEHENITAILWAGLPGQESGRSLVDVLYGRINPGAKTPFTWGKKRSEYGPEILWVQNNGIKGPQTDLSEAGVFIDYRNFDKKNVTPVYEFGFGLSYTSFEFSDLEVKALNADNYTATTGYTKAAPVLGKVGKAADYLYSSGFKRITQFLYPWLTSTNLKEASGDPYYGLNNSAYLPAGVTNGSAQPLLPASGSSGGNPLLYEDLIQVTCNIVNTGSVTGDEVPQLYVSLGGDGEPVRVLRAFDRVTIAPGQTHLWTATLTRRDLSNWDVASQNWVITSPEKKVYVGNSSRQLPLSAVLPTVQ